jgi:hypothetical protein
MAHAVPDVFVNQTRYAKRLFSALADIEGDEKYEATGRNIPKNSIE